MRLKWMTTVMLAAALAVPAAEAASPPGKGKALSPAGTSQNQGKKPPKSGRGCRPQVTVVLKGTLANAPGTAPTLPFFLQVNVTGSNRFGRPFVKASQPVTVTAAAGTIVRRQGAKTLASLRAEDRVLVQARACKADLAASTLPVLTAKRIIAHPAAPLGTDIGSSPSKGKPSNPGKGQGSGGGSGTPDTIALIAPWGNAAYAGGAMTVSYAISASRGVPSSTVDAVQAAIDHWNNCLNAGSNTFSETVNGTLFAAGDTGCTSHAWQLVPAPSGTSPLVAISIKKGGGTIAGSTKLSTDASGFLDAARVQISGSSFGAQNTATTVWEIAEHELGHVIGLGHSTVATDLMYPYLNGTVSTGSCEANGFAALYSWLGTATPQLPGKNEMSC